LDGATNMTRGDWLNLFQAAFCGIQVVNTGASALLQDSVALVSPRIHLYISIGALIVSGFTAAGQIWMHTVALATPTNPSIQGLLAQEPPPAIHLVEPEKPAHS
jgi:hypothetical protein